MTKSFHIVVFLIVSVICGCSSSSVSIPNPVYTIKECFEKVYNPNLNSNSNLNSNLLWSVDNELLKWKVSEFYEKLNAVDPTLRPKIEECVREVHKKFQRPRRRLNFGK